jgi:hypothetical protein
MDPPASSRVALEAGPRSRSELSGYMVRVGGLCGMMKILPFLDLSRPFWVEKVPPGSLQVVK